MKTLILALGLAALLEPGLLRAQTAAGSSAGRAPLLAAFPAAPRNWAVGFDMFRLWLDEPAAMKLVIAADPHLSDLKFLDVHGEAGQLAAAPLAEKLALKLETPERRAEFLARLIKVPFLPREEQRAVIQELSSARRAAADEVQTRLRQAAQAVRDGRASPEDMVGLFRRLWAFRIYGEGAEAALRDIQSAAAENRIAVLLAKTKEIVEKEWKVPWDAGGLPSGQDALPEPIAPRLRSPAFYRDAAMKGSVSAQHALGLIHEQGANGIPNLAKAYAWQARAAALGHTEARRAMVRLLDYLSPRLLERAEKAAAEFLAKLAIKNLRLRITGSGRIALEGEAEREIVGDAQ